MYRHRARPILDLLDYLIIAYIVYLSGITMLWGGGLPALVYGGRYDFEFLIVFLIYRHGAQYLDGRFSDYVRLFLISSTIMLVFGILVRFLFKETVLLYFGYSASLSNWQFGGSIPIYHGIPGANIRRFQGILDGPNPAAYFIFLYLGLLIHAFRKKEDYYFLLGIWIAILFGLVLMTYSRSALIGLVLAVVILVVIQLRTIVTRHARAAVVSAAILAVVFGLFYLRYEYVLSDIFVREGSSKGHFERMMIGFQRFASHPLGEGLASSGPAYRYILAPKDTDLNVGAEKAQEDYYIPESWYVQQLVEGGVIGAALFGLITLVLLYYVYLASLPLFTALLSVVIMNAFLHTYESVYITVLLFLFLGYLLSTRAKKGQ